MAMKRRRHKFCVGERMIKRKGYESIRSVMTKVVELPVQQTVAQDDLRELWLMEEILERKRKSIRDKILSGAVIEPGRYRSEIKDGRLTVC